MRQSFWNGGSIFFPLIQITGNTLVGEEAAKNLGITFDESLSWTKQVNIMICKAYASLRSLFRFKKMLSPESKQRLCEALVLSHFNYCDVLFPHLKTALESKIQKVQNCCVRFIFNIRKYDREHITPYVLKLGWLNMKNRRLHHSLTLMYKIDKKNCSQLSH